jgi:pimeloyl-ACP methyl ester carboxylesterase
LPFRVIAWNAPGYMLSDDLLAETPDWRDWADALHNFLTALGIGRFDVWANSFGTRVAQCFAAACPDRIARAVFSGTSIAQGTSPEERARTAEGRARMIARGGFGFGERAPALLGSRASPDVLAIVRHVLRATQPKGFLRATRFVASGSAPPMLGEGLSVPLLMIQGAEDRVTPAAANAALLAQALPQARIETIEGCGHLPEVEDHERINELARGFLQ